MRFKRELGAVVDVVILDNTPGYKRTKIFKVPMIENRQCFFGRTNEKEVCSRMSIIALQAT